MYSRVEILHGHFAWYLRIESIDSAGATVLVTIMPFKRLIEALDAACILQLNIDNEHELPINNRGIYDYQLSKSG